MHRKLQTSEFEDLSAYLDGELPEERAEEVRRLLETDPTWQQERGELAALDKALDVWRTPAPCEDLPDRILRSLRAAPKRSPVVIRLVQVAASLAVAAAILVAVAVLQPGSKVTTPEPLSAVEVKLADETITQNMEMLGLFGDFEVIENFETLEAIERLENGT